MSTGAILGWSLFVLASVWSWLEWRTLTDNVPDNHITATVRRAIKAQPGPFILLAFALGFLAGHLAWW